MSIFLLEVRFPRFSAIINYEESLDLGVLSAKAYFYAK
jgi:hypothetical protein